MVTMDGTQTDRDGGKVPGEESKERMSGMRGGMIRKVRRWAPKRVSVKDI